VQFLYDGGVLSEEQLASIRLQEEELLSWRLVAPEELPGMLSPAFAGRLLAALEALRTGTGPADLEDGRPAR
jgi:hypothetical protein